MMGKRYSSEHQSNNNNNNITVGEVINRSTRKNMRTEII